MLLDAFIAECLTETEINLRNEDEIVLSAIKQRGR